MSRKIVQEYVPDRLGRRRPVHTDRLYNCRCTGCCQRRWWTPERKAARAAEIRQQFADGRRAWHPEANLARASHWTPERDAILQEKAGYVDIPTLIDVLEQRFGYRYSESAVKHRIKRLGIYLLDRRPYTSSEVARMLGMSRNNLLTVYVATGKLRGTMRRGGQHGMWTFARADLEAFVTEHLPNLTITRFTDSRLRALAQAQSRGRLVLSAREVAERTGVSPFVQYALYRDGLVPSARRVRRAGAGRSGGWAIDASDLATVTAAAEARHHAHRTAPRSQGGQFLRRSA